MGITDYFGIQNFKHFQRPLKLDSKTFKHQIRFQGLSRALKMENISRTFKEEWLLCKYSQCTINMQCNAKITGMKH